MKKKEYRLSKKEAELLELPNWFRDKHGNKRFSLSPEQFKEVLKYRKVKGVKRLYLDIETGYYTARLWRIGKVGWVGHQQIKEDKQIICISYKWEHEDIVHNVDWSKGEKPMIENIVEVMNKADEIVAQNGDRFDIKEIRTRCIYYGIMMRPKYRTLDTLKKARQFFNFASNKLDFIGEFLTGEGKIKTDFQLWIDVVEGKCPEALKEMITYCNGDVIKMEHVFHIMNPYINHNNNFAVMKGVGKWQCPECISHDVKVDYMHFTAMGVIRVNLICNDCGKQYTVSNKTYMDMLTDAMIKGNSE